MSKMQEIFTFYKKQLDKLLFAVVPKSYRVHLLRKHGVKIGENCRISNIKYSTEPYLIEIGDHVAIASRTELITHDGGVWIFRHEQPEVDLFGKIKIGNNTFIGVGCIILPNSTIGNNCVIGAGSVVRGVIPDNSIAIGNPAKVIMKTSIYKRLVEFSPYKMDGLNLTFQEKKDAITKLINNKSRGK
jgi:Acetyltransferase (isoleucine patch superfamily)